VGETQEVERLRLPFSTLFSVCDCVAPELDQSRLVRVLRHDPAFQILANARIVSLITGTLCQAACEPITLIKGSQRQQTGITGDLTTRKISSNDSVSVEGKRQLWYITRCHLWVLRKRMLGLRKTQCSSIF
jgi:hypothetical protein